MRFFSIVLLIASFQLYAADPSWIHGGGFKEYQGQKYITSLGEGSSASDARKNAISGLAEQLKVSISSQSDIVKEYQSNAGEFSKKESMNIQITTKVDLESIEGIKIVQQYYQSDSNIYYAFAVLDKVKNATDLAFKIEGEFAQVRSQLEQAKNLISKGQGSDGFSILSQSSQLFQSITSDIELHKLFGNSGANSLLKEDARELVTKFDDYLGQIYQKVKFNVTNGHEKPGSPELGVTEPYQVVITYNGQPLKNVPVIVEAQFDNAVIDIDDTTDRRGEISIQVRSFNYTDKQQNKLSVQLRIYSDLFIHSPPKAELIVLLSQKSEVTVQLETSIKSPSNDFLYLTVNDGLSSILSEENYQVLTEEGSSQIRPDYVIEVKGNVVNLPGFNGLYFSKISGVVRISSGKSNRSLKTIRINADATKAGGLNSDIAAEKATAKLVNAIKSDLLETLEQNLGRN